jgi:prephenate dehydrogenase
MAKRLFNKVAIVGVGLIGGSLGMALKKKGLAAEVVGLTRRRETIRLAIKNKAIDKGFLQPSKALKDADLIVLATPVETILDFIPKITELLKKGSLVIDVGSCKEKIVSAMERKMPKGVWFVGCHPLAGSEKKGVNFSDARIFKGTLCVITPTGKTNQDAVKRIRKLWQLLGCRVVIWDPRTHDKRLALLSHLPHVLAFNLIETIPAEQLQFSPRSLRDATRIASSDPQLWKEVFLLNAPQVLKAVASFQARLNGFKRMIVNKNGSGLLKAMKRAKAKRDTL